MNIKFYILAIERDFRGEKLMETLASRGVNYEVVWGIDATLSPQPENFRDDEKSNFLYGRNLTASEIACTLGHRIILERAVNDNLDFAIVLEDDVVISNVEVLLDRIKLLVSLSQPSLFLLIPNNPLCLYAPISLPMHHRLGLNRIYSNPGGACAYILNKEAISVLSQISPDQWKGHQADFPLFYRDILNYFAVTEVSNSIFLRMVSSTIDGRTHTPKDWQRKITSLAIDVLQIFSPSARRHGLSVMAGLSHFIGRRVAWLLHRVREKNLARSERIVEE